MALLHIMAKVRNRWDPKLELAVIHFNHKLRQEADEEVYDSIFYSLICSLCLSTDETSSILSNFIPGVGCFRTRMG